MPMDEEWLFVLTVANNGVFKIMEVDSSSMTTSGADKMIEEYCRSELQRVLHNFYDENNLYSDFSITKLNWDRFLTYIAQGDLFDDMARYIQDPAATTMVNPCEYVLESNGFKAVLHYRIASALYRNATLTTNEYWAKRREQLAAELSFRAAKETTIEIHPGAIIGKGFVIDHGINTTLFTRNETELDRRNPVYSDFTTVIGQRCTIGEDCTILQGVVLGAVLDGSNTDPANRHPHIGHKVVICSGVRIIGGITIHDNVTINPCCIVTRDIPSNSEVSIINELQIQKPKRQSEGSRQLNGAIKTTIFGLIPSDSAQNVLTLYGDQFNDHQLSLVRFSGGTEIAASNYSIVTTSRTNTALIFSVHKANGYIRDASPYEYSLKISGTQRTFILLAPPALKRAIDFVTQQEN